MSEIKLPRPIEDYLIGKYDNGVCYYLITKEAYNNWKTWGATVNHLCVKNNEGLNLVNSLTQNAKYKAFEFKSMPIGWQPILTKDYPELAKQLCEYYYPKPAIKSEPTPDRYYIIYRAESGSYHTVLRKNVDNLNSDVNFNGPKWDTPNGSWYHNPVYLKEKKHENTWYKTFLQLSSEVKAKLQELNPERYREWEQFYMKKYPDFKSLEPQDAINQLHCSCGICNDCLKRKPLPDPKDDYIIVNADEFGLCRRKDFTQSAAAFVYMFNYGWRFKAVVKHPEQEEVLEKIKSFSSCLGIRAILPKFEEYYSELEQKKTAIHQQFQCNQDLNKYYKGSGLDINNKLNQAGQIAEISQNKFYEKQNNTLNLKQQNNEHIIVCRKAKPIVGCQIIRGTATQGNGIKPATTRGHLSYKPRAISCQKSTRSSKIILSTKFPSNH